MKNLLIIGLLCLTFFAGQQIFAQETSKREPTKSETASWLQEKFRGFVTSAWRRKKATSAHIKLNDFKKDSVTFGDCEMSFRSYDTNYEIDLGGTIHLKDIDSSRIESRKENSSGEWDLVINSHNNKDVFDLGYLPYNSMRSYELGNSSMLFLFSDENIRDRVAVALKAAIKQCGGDEEKEPF